ncbi:hypothetical protein [Ramlibacter sp.]|uniref:virion core protein, T7 gp14 family n=1 Tax=Ramlibacter sp. TaxID=1917967 RepID=UPI00260E157C|nr:hypothetical protein [Ramlibacter sp.]MDB5957695.1 hypothetical protein [Ramlibacter sp.]
MAFIAPALPYIGMALAAYSAYSGSQANKSAANIQAQVAANNAKMAEYQTEDATARGDQAAQAQGMRTDRLKGTQRAALASNGVDLGQGSAVQILSDTDYFGQVDKTTILDNAAREAWSYRAQGANFDANASILRNRANAENPWLAAGTSFLGSATRVAPSWYAGMGTTMGSSY